jgi:hypothetical protein
MDGRASYVRYLQYRGRTEEEVLPLVRHREVYDDPKLQAHLKQIEKAAAIGDPTARIFWEVLNPASNLNTNDLLNVLNHEFRTRMRAVDWDLPENIVVGVYPTGEVHARVEPWESGSIVLLNTGLIEAMEAMHFLALQDEDTIAKVPKLRKVVGCATRNEIVDPLEFRSSTLKYDRLRIVYEIANYAALFIIAHEYAHRALGHNPHRQVDGGEEFEADVWSVIALLLHAAKKSSELTMGSACSAPFTFLALDALIEAFGFKPQDDRYPSSLDRICILELFLHQQGYAQKHSYLWWRLNEICELYNTTYEGEPYAPKPTAKIAHQLREILPKLKPWCDKVMKSWS